MAQMEAKIRSLMSIFIASVIVYFAISAALRYGAIWDSRVTPKAGVEVVLISGTSVTGSLSRAWSGEWIVENAAGERWQFTDFKEMKFPMPTGETSLFAGWRRFMLAAVIFWLFAWWQLMPLLRRLSISARQRVVQGDRA